MRKLTLALLTSTAIVVAAGSVQAADYRTAPPAYVAPAPADTWWIGVEGQWVNYKQDQLLFGQEDDPGFSYIKPDKGWAGGVEVGVRPGGGAWDFAFRARYGKANTTNHSYSGYYTPDPGFSSDNAQATHNAWHGIADFEVGRNVGIGGPTGGATLRGTFGLRFAAFSQKTEADVFSNNDTPSDYQVTINRNFWGVGPRIGLSGSMPIMTPGLSIDASVGAAALFGMRHFDRNFSEYNVPASPNFNDLIEHGPASYTQGVLVPNYEAYIGLSWNLGTAKISAGYRWDFYGKALESGYNLEEPSQTNILLHGAVVSVKMGF